jgi:hypothetical protein
MIALIDQPAQRMFAGFLLAPPDTFADLGGAALLTEVTLGFRLEEEPADPAPAWWWAAAPPPALARPPEAVP